MRIIFLLLIFTSPLISDDSWLEKAKQNIDQEAMVWAKQQLKQDLSKISKKSDQVLVTEKKQCTASVDLQQDQEPQLFIFMSFSVPEASWIALSKELEKLPGQFVLQGIPNNQFSHFSSKVKHLTDQSVLAPISLHPKLFQKFQIEKVPAIVVVDGNRVDKIYGNISLFYALEKLSEKGETESAKSLYQQLRKKSL